MKARVYFSEADSKFWLKRFLQDGFSHCFIDIEGVLINPLHHYTSIEAASDLYECTDYIDIEIEEPAWKARTIWQPFDCVSIVKSFLGLHKWGILTPYQLFKHLRSEHG